MTTDKTPETTDKTPEPPERRAFNTKLAGIYADRSESWLTKARLGLTKTPGPKFIKLGKRVSYLREDLDAFLDSSD